MLTLDEFAVKLGIHSSTVRRMLKEGRLQGIKMGRDWKFSEGYTQKILKDGIPQYAVIEK